jgi:hypothetical protein
MARITIGSLVRHRVLGAVGLVVEHTMWNAECGAIGVKFNKPVNKGAMKDVSYLLDRADRWELVSGCDNQ